jgi:hypothetical protein
MSAGTSDRPLFGGILKVFVALHGNARLSDFAYLSPGCGAFMTIRV